MAITSRQGLCSEKQGSRNLLTWTDVQSCSLLLCHAPHELQEKVAACLLVGENRQPDCGAPDAALHTLQTAQNIQISKEEMAKAVHMSYKI